MNAVRRLTLVAVVFALGAAMPQKADQKQEDRPLTVDPVDLISVPRSRNHEGGVDRLKEKYDGKLVRYTATLSSATEDAEKDKYQFDLINTAIEKRGKFEPATHRVWCIVYFKEDKEEAAVFTALKASQKDGDHPIVRLCVEGRAKVTKSDMTPLTINECKLISLKTLPK
jgi:hypothetical protein